MRGAPSQLPFRGVEAQTPAVDAPDSTREHARKSLPRRLLRWLAVAVAAVAWLWTCGGLHFLAKFPSGLALLLIPGLPLALRFLQRWKVSIAACALVLFAWMLIVFQFLTKPSGHRDWWEGNRRSPVVRFDKKPEFDPAASEVGIQNVRHFKWRTRDDFVPSWQFETFYLDEIDALDLVIEPLGDSKHFAHTMLSFGFGPEKRVVISVEARRERGERFSMPAGMYKQFELFYQFNSENDAFTLRALEADANLYVYPVKASPEFIRALFLDMVKEAARLLDNPEFYHSLKANCTTKLFEHVNRSLDEPIRYGAEILFPAKAGELLYRLGWMDTELDFAAAKQRFRLVDKVRQFDGDADFSKKIRE